MDFQTQTFKDKFNKNKVLINVFDALEILDNRPPKVNDLIPSTENINKCQDRIFIQGDEDTQDTFNCKLTGIKCSAENCPPPGVFPIGDKTSPVESIITDFKNMPASEIFYKNAIYLVFNRITKQESYINGIQVKNIADFDTRVKLANKEIDSFLSGDFLIKFEKYTPTDNNSKTFESLYYKLWEYLYNEHNCILLENDLQQIYNIVNDDFHNQYQQSLIGELSKEIYEAYEKLRKIREHELSCNFHPDSFNY